MKKLSTILMAAVFMLSAGACFAGTNALQDYQAKRNAAIQKQDAKLNALQKKQEKTTGSKRSNSKKTTAKKRCSKKSERLF